MTNNSIFSDLNNVNEDTVVTTQLSEYYGFTEPEVSELFKADAQELPKIRRW